MNTKKTNSVISNLIIALLAFTALNYLLTLLQGISEITQCDATSQNVTFMEIFFKQNFPDFFNVLPYNLTLGIYILFIDLVVTYGWVVNDIFIIVLSFIIAKTFRMFNKRLSLNIAVRNYLTTLIF